MSEQTKHNNRAVWGDRWEPGTYAAPLGTYAITFGQRFESGSGDRWNQSLTICEAKGLCSALSDALGVELHAKGTAAKLQELEAQAEADAATIEEAAKRIREMEAKPAGAIDYERVRELLPELADYSDRDIEGVPTILRYVAAVHPTHLQDCGWVGMCSVRGYVQWENGACWLTNKGINALSIFDACRVEPDTLTSYERGLLATLLWVDTARPKGLYGPMGATPEYESLLRWYDDHTPDGGAWMLTDAGKARLSDLWRKAGRQPDPDPAIPEGLSDGALGALVMLLRGSSYVGCDKVIDELKCLGLVNENITKIISPTDTGRALATRIAANMRRKAPEPEPMGYSLRAILGLAAQYESSIGNMTQACREGLVGDLPPFRPTDLGNTVWANVLQRLGLQEKTTTEPEQWSEPVRNMCYERCEDIAGMIGYVISAVKYPFAWVPLGVGTEAGLDAMKLLPGTARTYGDAIRLALAHVATIKGRYDPATDRVRLDGLEVARG